MIEVLCHPILSIWITRVSLLLRVSGHTVAKTPTHINSFAILRWCLSQAHCLLLCEKSQLRNGQVARRALAEDADRAAHGGVDVKVGSP